jgi:acyl-CoA thioesterase-1
MRSPIRIACFGDSLTEGYGLNAEESLPNVLERLLHERGIAARCLNLGISGDTTADGLTRIGAVLETAPDAAIVEFGANDCFLDEPVVAVRDNLTRILEQLRQNTIPVLLVGISATLNPDGAYRNAFDALFPDLARRFGLELFPNILASYFGHPELTLLDGLHPNAQGVEAVARDLLPQVIELVRQTGN